MYVCYNVEETDLLEALQMRDILTPDDEEWSDKWIPRPSNIKKNGMNFYIRLIWEFQSVVEARMEEVPNEKGVRAFSLFPVSTSFVNAHIVINCTTLAGFLSRIRDRGKGNVLDDWNLLGVRLSCPSFKQHRWTVLRKAFQIDHFQTRRPDCPLSRTEFQQLSVEEKYEHASHLFANQVTTDGYSASVLYFCPKSEVPERAEDEPVVPAGYSLNVVIGLDPGMRAVCTAAREYLRQETPRRRRRRAKHRPRRPRRKKGSKRKKRNYPRWIRRPKRPRPRNNRDIVSVTTREYRHLAGFNRFRAWNEGQKKQYPDYKSVIDDMPSFKTSSYKLYLKRLAYFWKHAAFLLRFCVERP